VGAHAQEDRSAIDVERFLSLVRFENQEMLDELGLDI
jgi:hypothetical protein